MQYERSISAIWHPNYGHALIPFSLYIVYLFEGVINLVVRWEHLFCFVQEITVQHIMSSIHSLKKDMVILEKTEFTLLRSESEVWKQKGIEVTLSGRIHHCTVSFYNWEYFTEVYILPFTSKFTFTISQLVVQTEFLLPDT